MRKLSENSGFRSGYFFGPMMKLLGILTAALLISGCFSHAPAPVPVINKSPDRVIPEAYQVKKGDSIYNIAWAFGLDYVDIAEWSNLEKPYRLKAGQIVYLKKPQVKSTALPSPVEYEPVIATALPDNPPAAPAVKPAETKKVEFAANPGKWNWPAEGKLVGKYAPDQGSNGIQIAGAQGSPVKSTASGEVVYVGEGLRGYGKLIILKHSEEFLSAYAHNQDILVQEGESISAAQKIATMGDSGAESVMLHFEIRQDGKPVDPLQYLN